MGTDYKTRRQERLLSILWKVLFRYSLTCLIILLVLPFCLSWNEMQLHHELTGFLLQDFWSVLEYLVLTILPTGWWLIILIATVIFSFTAIGIRWLVLMIRRII